MFKQIIIFVSLSLQVYASVFISVIKPVNKKVNITIDVMGVVQSNNSVNITAKTTGILKIIVANNTFVKKGQIIAYVSSMLRNKKLKFLQEQVKLLKNESKIQENRVIILKDKYTMGVGSKNSYLNAKIVYKQFQEHYNSTKNRYKMVLLEKKNSTIYAPNSGIITRFEANNSYIHYGSKIASLLDNNNFVKLFVDASYATKIKKDMDVRIVSSYQDSDAKVISVLPKSSNNLIEVMVQADKKLPLNLQVDAKITVKKIDGILIPKESIVLVNNHPAIYIIDKKNIAHLFFIEVVKDMVNKALIKNTLPKDTDIALENAYMLHNNLKVSVK